MKRKIIKGLFAVIVIICLCLSCGLIVFAHPGDTDEYGGHYDRETGDYHYHHGYSAHYHTNGTCPYDFDDRTGWLSGSSSGSSVKTTTNPPVTTTRAPSATVSTTGPVWDPYLRPGQQPTTTPEQTAEENDTAVIIGIVILLFICVIPIVAFCLIYNHLFKSDIVYTQKKTTAELKKGSDSMSDSEKLTQGATIRKKLKSRSTRLKIKKILETIKGIALLLAILASIVLPIYFSVTEEDKKHDDISATTSEKSISNYTKDEDRALEKGYDIGYDEGQLEGYKTGYAHGVDDGFEEGVDILGDEVCYLLEDLESQLDNISPDTEEESSALLEIEELISDIYDECGW